MMILDCFKWFSWFNVQFGTKQCIFIESKWQSNQLQKIYWTCSDLQVISDTASLFVFWGTTQINDKYFFHIFLLTFGGKNRLAVSVFSVIEAASSQNDAKIRWRFLLLPRENFCWILRKREDSKHCSMQAEFLRIDSKLWKTKSEILLWNVTTNRNPPTHVMILCSLVANTRRKLHTPCWRPEQIWSSRLFSFVVCNHHSLCRLAVL